MNNTQKENVAKFFYDLSKAVIVAVFSLGYLQGGMDLATLYFSVMALFGAGQLFIFAYLLDGSRWSYL